MDHATVNQAGCQCSGESAARRAAGKDNMGKHAVPSKCQQRKSRPYEETSRPDVPVPTTNLCTCPQHELLLQTQADSTNHRGPSTPARNNERVGAPWVRPPFHNEHRPMRTKVCCPQCGQGVRCGEPQAKAHKHKSRSPRPRYAAAKLKLDERSPRHASRTHKTHYLEHGFQMASMGGHQLV